MVRGRPRKPTELKRRLGTLRPGRERAIFSPPTAPIAAPTAPAGLTPLGREAWRRLWAVSAAWLHPTTDLAIVTRLCEAYDEREQLRAEVKRYGHLVAKQLTEAVLDGEATTSMATLDGLKANPAVRALRDLEDLIGRYEGLCGFTPTDRIRMDIAEAKAQSKLDEFLGRRDARPADVPGEG